MAPRDIGWLAGIIDGEGWIALQTTNLTYPHLKNAIVEINQTDKDIVEKFSNLVGTKMKGPYRDKRKTTYKPFWRCRVMHREQVNALLKAVYPLLCKRRQEATQQVLEYIND